MGSCRQGSRRHARSSAGSDGYHPAVPLIRGMPLIGGRSSTNGRRQPRQRSPIIPIVLAVVFVGIIAAAGFTLYRNHHWTARPVTASPAGNQAPSGPLAPPAAPACGDDGELLAQM